MSKSVEVKEKEIITFPIKTNPIKERIIEWFKTEFGIAPPVRSVVFTEITEIEKCRYLVKFTVSSVPYTLEYKEEITISNPERFRDKPMVNIPEHPSTN